jgi:tRNA 2-thiouridine synthesizing protein C
MKSVLFLVRSAPYGSAAIPESVRACLGFGTMPMEVNYVLMDDAVWAMALSQRPETIGSPPAQQILGALADLDVNLFAEAAALEERGLEAAEQFRPVSLDGIADLIARADAVMTY